MKTYQTLEELKKAMGWHVQREVKHYQADFQIDCEALEDIPTGAQLIWITRECGTHLIRIGGAALSTPDQLHGLDHLRAVLECWHSVNAYCITIGPKACTMEKTDAARLLSTCKAELQNARKYRVDYFANCRAPLFQRQYIFSPDENTAREWASENAPVDAPLFEVMQVA